MNSNYFDFDLGLGSSRSKPLNDQKNKTPSYSSSSSSSFSSTQPKPSWQPNKPTWTHQPAPAQVSRTAGVPSGPTSMVGDIFGKSWTSSAPSGSTTGIGIGIAEKNPNLFGDLVSSALGGQSKTNSNVPLKNATPPSATNKTSFSMGNMADSLPKSNANWGSSDSFGFSTNNNNNSSSNISGISNKGTSLGGPSLGNMGNKGGGGVGMSTNKDPFVSLVDFGSKQQSGSLNSSSKSSKVDPGKDAFGDFQNAANSSSNTFPTSGSSANNNDFMGDFGMPSKDFGYQSQSQGQSVGGGDPLDMFFTPSTASGVGGQKTMDVDDWGLDEDIGGGGGNDHDVGGSTTEIEGLPPPPSGVSPSMAKNKGMDNYKQGQYADAIKWLSWAVVLLEKAGNDAGTVEVLSSRASCYKEVGEYKKAVADCTKMLEHNDANVSALVQRALLYESMEKYRLGAEDLRTVLKIDPSNRIARSTVHRLAKMAD